MSYYDNQWGGPSQNNWEHQGSTTPVRAGASAPQPQDDYAFSYQFEEVDRAYENLQKSGKGFGMGGRRKFSPMHHGHGSGSARSTPDFSKYNRMPHGGPRQHSVNSFDDPRGGPSGGNLHNFYASQRHQPSRGTNEAEQVMQAKRRMAAQRERELRNLHTEQQFQRNTVTDVPPPANNNNNSNNNHNSNNNVNSNMNLNSSNSNSNNNSNAGSNKHMTEEQTRDLIARQRSALYGEGQFADKSGYIDETGNVRPGIPGPSGPPSLRGASPLTFDNLGRPPPMGGDGNTPASAIDPMSASMDPSSRPGSTASPQTGGPTNRVFDNAVGSQNRTSNSSPTGASPPRDLAPGSKPQSGASVAPIGTRPSVTPSNSGGSKRSTTPLASSGGWGRGNGVWGQSSGLGTQASVWG